MSPGGGDAHVCREVGGMKLDTVKKFIACIFYSFHMLVTRCLRCFLHPVTSILQTQAWCLRMEEWRGREAWCFERSFDANYQQRCYCQWRATRWVVIKAWNCYCVTMATMLLLSHSGEGKKMDKRGGVENCWKSICRGKRSTFTSPIC